MLDVTAEAALHRCLIELGATGLVHSACDISDGGAFAAMIEAGFARNLGVEVKQTLKGDAADAEWTLKERIFSEIPSSVLLSADPASVEAIQKIVARHAGAWLAPLGTITAGEVKISFVDEASTAQLAVISGPVAEFKTAWSDALEAQLAEEVLA